MVCETLFSYCDTSINMVDRGLKGNNVVGDLYWSRMIPGCGQMKGALSKSNNIDFDDAEKCQQLYAVMTTGSVNGKVNEWGLAINGNKDQDDDYQLDAEIGSQRNPANYYDKCFVDVSRCHPTCGRTAFDNAALSDQSIVNQSMISSASSMSLLGGMAGQIIPIPGVSLIGTAIGFMAGATKGRKQGMDRVQSFQRAANCESARANCNMGTTDFVPTCTDWYPTGYAAPDGVMSDIAGIIPFPNF
jgi:hypothetical protein